MRARIPLAVVTLLAVTSAPPVDAAPRCQTKAADGTGSNKKVAQFQAYEGILKSVGLATWSQWMIDGQTPGYKISAKTYVCRNGAGLGVSCRARAQICRI